MAAPVTDSPLGVLINRQIELSGPMPLPVYMALCLTHPEFGYYTNRDPLGRGGDFITAPEISQLFGEMIGVWVSAAWQAMGSPERFEIAELGPGRGTMLADAGRVLALGGAAHAAEFVLVETSSVLQKAQEKRLGTHKVRWVPDVAGIGADGPPLIILANEFFDALPIRQFQRQAGQWHERAVGLEGDQRVWGLTDEVLPEGVMSGAGEDEIIELGLAARSLMLELAQVIKARGGALLAIDYGYGTTQTGETLQAIMGHAYANSLARPGEADLTAHVDFEALAQAALEGGLQPLPLMTQQAFLDALGMEARRAALVSANPQEAKMINEGAARLSDTAQMGTLFKVFCASAGAVAPYPFVGETTNNAA